MLQCRHCILQVLNIYIQLALQPTLSAFRESEYKADSHRDEQTSAQRARPPSIVVIDSSPLLDVGHAPDVDAHAVEEGNDCDNRERPSGGHGDAVAEVEERCGDGAQDDGEFELEHVSDVDRAR